MTVVPTTATRSLGAVAHVKNSTGTVRYCSAFEEPLEPSGQPLL